MTRFAKMARKRHLDPTPWSELKKPVQNDDEGMCSTDHLHEESGHNESEKHESNDHIENHTNNEAEKKTKRKKKHEKNPEESEANQEKQTGQEEKNVADNSDYQINEKLEKRKQARRLRRQKMKKCFNCRKPGHSVKDCPMNSTDSGACYHCASAEHTTKNCPNVSAQQTKDSGHFPFAICFICKEKGHIARVCPQNPRGLYPEGGGCKMCGSVEHFKKDCPEFQATKKEKPGLVLTSWKKADHFSVDSLDNVDKQPVSMLTVL